MTKTASVITVNRKFATIFSFVFLITSVVLSGYFFYNTTYIYSRKLEEKLVEATRAYNEVKYLENEAMLLENKKQEFLNAPKLIEEGEFINTELKNVIEKVLESKAVDINYFYLKANNVDYPILFEETPVVYFVSYKTGDE